MKLKTFLQSDSGAGTLLVVAAVLAMVVANSSLATPYAATLAADLKIGFGALSLSKSVLHWINDGLMAVFFLFVGLEIKRELVAGELARFRQAIIPIAGAIGGMVVPALVYVAILRGGAGSQGWGVPVATDIAFALGVLMLAGSRVPFGLKVMLLALAITDDIGGILIIALFYSDGISTGPLALAGGTVALCLVLRQAGIWYFPLYWVIGAVGWAATLESGIHPTIFGVVMGLLTPWQAWRPAGGFVARMRALVARVQEVYDPETQQATHGDQVALSLEIASEAHEHVSPLDRLEHALSPFSAYVIAPLFAFANAGVAVDASTLGDALRAPVAQGVFLGLVLGKPLGILLAIRIAVALGARLPEGVTWGSIAGLGIVAGIGFTVALFIAGLSFEEAALLTDAKLGILAASLVAGILGWTVLRLVHAPRDTA